MAAQGQASDGDFFDYAKAVIAKSVNAVMKDGTVAAVAREAIKDIRNTNHELWFGRPEGMGEPGAPLNPTQGEIAAGREGSVYGDAAEPQSDRKATVHDIHRDKPAGGSVHGQDTRDNGRAMAPSGGGKEVIGHWTGEYDRRASSPPDDYQRAEDKSLADDQKEQKTQGKGQEPNQPEEQKEREDKERDRGGRGGRC